MAIGDSPSPADPRIATPNLFASDSDTPWLARKDWASGQLCYNAGVKPGIFIGCIGLILLILAFPFAADLPHSIRPYGSYMLIPLLILGTLGFAVTVHAVRLTIGGIKTGRVVLHLDAVSVPLGGPLRGKLKISKPIPAGQRVRLKLQCTSLTQTRGGPNDDGIFSSRVVFEHADTTVSDGSGTIGVSMVTPASAPASKIQPKKWPSHEPTAKISWVEWELSVDDPSERAEDLHAAFTLPVFKVAEFPAPVADLESIRAARTVELESYQPGPEFKVRMTRLPEGGTEFYFPPMRGAANAGAQTVFFLIMAAILGGVSGPLFNNLSAGISHSGDWLVVVLYATWAILTLFMFLHVLRLWFAPERLTITNGILSDTSGLFGKTRRMRVAEIAAIHAVPGGSRLSAIRIRRSDWRGLAVGDGIRERRDAERLAMQISRALGIKPSASLPTDDYSEELKMVQTFLDEMGAARRRQRLAGEAFPDPSAGEKGESS